ncbi:hypothetical protein B0J14DRAFT_562113 [Halenospora varia]|nr:hypothetical protein B0J14DRAFT_562113 [Halenospora varia]
MRGIVDPQDGTKREEALQTSTLSGSRALGVTGMPNRKWGLWGTRAAQVSAPKAALTNLVSSEISGVFQPLGVSHMQNDASKTLLQEEQSRLRDLQVKKGKSVHRYDDSRRAFVTNSLPPANLGARVGSAAGAATNTPLHSDGVLHYSVLSRQELACGDRYVVPIAWFQALRGVNVIASAGRPYIMDSRFRALLLDVPQFPFDVVQQDATFTGL